MKREVLAIRHVYFEDLGSLELVLGDRGQLVRYLDVGRARIDAPDPLDTSLMVVLGGPIGAYDDALFPHLNPLLAMLEKRIAAFRSGWSADASSPLAWRHLRSSRWRHAACIHGSLRKSGFQLGRSRPGLAMPSGSPGRPF